jgi:hypothetical protein
MWNDRTQKRNAFNLTHQLVSRRSDGSIFASSWRMWSSRFSYFLAELKAKKNPAKSPLLHKYPA